MKKKILFNDRISVILCSVSLTIFKNLKIDFQNDKIFNWYWKTNSAWKVIFFWGIIFPMFYPDSWKKRHEKKCNRPIETEFHFFKYYGYKFLRYTDIKVTSLWNCKIFLAKIKKDPTIAHSFTSRHVVIFQFLFAPRLLVPWYNAKLSA